jgi:hypothetical protein
MASVVKKIISDARIFGRPIVLIGKQLTTFRSAFPLKAKQPNTMPVSLLSGTS